MNDDELDPPIEAVLRALGDLPDVDPAFVDAVMARDGERDRRSSAGNRAVHEAIAGLAEPRSDGVSDRVLVDAVLVADRARLRRRRWTAVVAVAAGLFLVVGLLSKLRWSSAERTPTPDADAAMMEAEREQAEGRSVDRAPEPSPRASARASDAEPDRPESVDPEASQPESKAIDPPVAEEPPPSRPKASRPSANELLRLAQRHVTEGAHDEAVATYERLLAGYPATARARARLALGNLELGRGNASSALEHFEAYVRIGGALTDEARYGTIRALRALGRNAEELAAIEALLDASPSSPYATALERRRVRLAED